MSFAVRVYFRVSFGFVGIWFLKDVEFFRAWGWIGLFKVWQDSEFFRV